jgi:hypothetical protein
VRTLEEQFGAAGSVGASARPAECARYHLCISRYVHNQPSAPRPSQRLMITYALGACVRGRPPPWPHEPSRSHAAPTGASLRGEFFGTYLARPPDLAALRPFGGGGPGRLFSRPGWSPGCLAAGGRAVFVSAQAAPAVSGTASPRVAGPGSRTGLDLRFFVAGRGFEPGKTVVGDFTDRGRYCPYLGERHSNASFWHAFDMTAPYEPHTLAVWQLARRSSSRKKST